MTLDEINKIQTALTAGQSQSQDFQTAIDEAVRFHHKVSQLQEMLLVIQKKCEMELSELEKGAPVTKMHYALMLDYIMDVIEETRHIRAA